MEKMKKIIILAVLASVVLKSATAQIVSDSVFSQSIKTVILQKNGVELSMPVIRLGSSEKLFLSFDELSDNGTYFSYRIQHCTSDWQISDLPPSEFINGFETSSVGNSQFSFTTKQSYVNYWETIPNDMSRITASGNYILTVFPDSDPDSVIFTKRFMVYEAASNIRTEVGQVVGAEGRHHNQNVSVWVTAPKGQYFNNPQMYLHLYVQQNGRRDLLRQLPVYGISGNEIAYKWKDENVFPGGNEFRYFDVSNMNFPMYTTERVETFGGENFAYLKPEQDRSGKNYIYEDGLNGQFRVSAANKVNMDAEADYVWVNFALPMSSPRMDGSFHIAGNFTNWSLGEETRLEWNPKLKCYTARIYVKQGYYSYQIIFVPWGEREGLTSVLEGDFLEARNDYYVFLYQRYPSDRYDRLIGFSNVESWK